MYRAFSSDCDHSPFFLLMISVESIIEQSSWFMIMVKMCGLPCVCDFSSCGGICGMICLGWCIWSYQGHDMGTKKELC